MNEFSITFSQSCDDRVQFHELLESNGIEFSVSCDAMESVDTEEIIAIVFATAHSMIAALKHLSPIIIELIKTRKVIVKIGDSAVSVSHVKHLDAAVKAATEMSRIKDKTQ